MCKLLLLTLAYVALVSGETTKNAKTNSTVEASLPDGSQFSFVGITSGVFDSFDGKVRNMEQACANLDYTFRKYFW